MDEFDGALIPRIVGFSVPRPSAYYTGRSDEIGTLIKTLDERCFVALIGGAGTGKTQLALQYAVAAAGGLPNEKINVAPHPGGVYYVLGENEKQLAAELVTIASTFGHSDVDSSNLQAAVTAVIGTLRQKTKRWLLVVDNCDQPNLLCELGRIIKILSRAAKSSNQSTLADSGRIIVTSRCQDEHVWSRAPTPAWARSESGDNGSTSLSVITLRTLNSDDAHRQLVRRYFHKRVSKFDWAGVKAKFQELDPADKKALPVLIELLKRHPLAIQQCGAFVYHYNTSFSDYLMLFQDRQLPKVEAIDPELIPVHRAWELNVDRLSKTMLHLLCILSLFEGDYIPIGLFNDVVKQTEAGNEADVHKLLVQQTALLRLGGYDNPDVVSMLRVFRTFLHQTRFETVDTSRRTSTPTPKMLDQAVWALWAYADRACGKPTTTGVDAAYKGGCRAAWNHRRSSETTAGFQLLPHITSVLNYVRDAKVISSVTVHKSADLATLCAGLMMQKSNYKESQVSITSTTRSLMRR